MHHLEHFTEIPGSLGYSHLCVWPAGGEKPPKSFAWMIGAGIYYGNLDFSSEQMLIDCRLIRYPNNIIIFTKHCGYYSDVFVRT